MSFDVFVLNVSIDTRVDFVFNFPFNTSQDVILCIRWDQRKCQLSPITQFLIFICSYNTNLKLYYNDPT